MRQMRQTVQAKKLFHPPPKLYIILIIVFAMAEKGKGHKLFKS